MALKYLITGATGGLGGGVLQQISKHAPKSDYAASSSRLEVAEQLESSGIQLRHADYQDPDSLGKAYLFLRTPMTMRRGINSIAMLLKLLSRPALDMFVGFYNVNCILHILAWGGYSTDSKIDVQQAYYVCEAMLKECILHLPGAVAYASRVELAEATANLMMEDGYEKQIVLLTSAKAVTSADLVETINNVTGRGLTVEEMPIGKYTKERAANDEGAKSDWWFEKRISRYRGTAKGAGKSVDSLMGELPGRKPKDGTEVVREIVTAEPLYTWHQNYAKK
ncbi:MAG: hypothetical protein Q9175_006507 [Cornicularia normoerica]